MICACADSRALLVIRRGAWDSFSPTFLQRSSVCGAPFSSMMVAYLLFASGHELLLQRPVTLCLLRQKFCFSVFDLKLQWTWPTTCRYR